MNTGRQKALRFLSRLSELLIAELIFQLSSIKIILILELKIYKYIA